MMHDVIVVGGSFAGLAAATQVARARRKVLVVDAGRPRNRFAAASHGFLTQDGRHVDDILGDARAQLAGYTTFQEINGMAAMAEKRGEIFSVTLEDGTVQEGRRLVLATGVTDILPDMPGLMERWGRGVYHCPYCHGYELGGGRIAVLAIGEVSMHQALLLADWGEITLLTNGSFAPNTDQSRKLEKQGVEIVHEVVEEVSGTADVRLAGGKMLHFAGLFTVSRTEISSPLAAQLGCTIIEGPLGTFIETEAFMKTSIPGVFACGDAARATGSVSTAVGDGAMAGMGAHQSLVFE